MQSFYVSIAFCEIHCAKWCFQLWPFHLSFCNLKVYFFILILFWLLLTKNKEHFHLKIILPWKLCFLCKTTCLLSKRWGDIYKHILKHQAHTFWFKKIGKQYAHLLNGSYEFDFETNNWLLLKGTIFIACLHYQDLMV